MAPLAEDRPNNFLIGRRVLNHQHAQRVWQYGRRLQLGQIPSRSMQCALDRVEQVRLRDRFLQISGDLKILEAIGKDLSVDGRQHQNDGSRQVMIVPNFSRKLEPVLAGHQSVDQDQAELLMTGMRHLKQAECRIRVTHGSRSHSPTAEHLFQDEAVGPIIVHDQHGLSAQFLDQGNRSRRGG